jgi:hypothetical protein
VENPGGNSRAIATTVANKVTNLQRNGIPQINFTLPQINFFFRNLKNTVIIVLRIIV